MDESEYFKPPSGDHMYIIKQSNGALVVNLYTPDLGKMYIMVQMGHDIRVSETPTEPDAIIITELYLGVKPEEAWKFFSEKHKLPKASEMVVAIVEAGPDGVPSVRPPGVAPIDEHLDL
jgi:hypothetical protein